MPMAQWTGIDSPSIPHTDAFYCPLEFFDPSSIRPCLAAIALHHRSAGALGVAWPKPCVQPERSPLCVSHATSYLAKCDCQ